MSNTTTKRLILSQPKTGQEGEVSSAVLTHVSILSDEATIIKVEVPGIDPATVDVNLEENSLFISCELGKLSLPINPAIDISKIEADILWGMLTIKIPLPAPPVSRSIKVNTHDTAKKVPSAKATEKFTAGD